MEVNIKEKRRNNMEEEIYDNLEYLFDKFRVDAMDMLQDNYNLSYEEAEDIFERFIKEKY